MPSHTSRPSPISAAAAPAPGRFRTILLPCLFLLGAMLNLTLIVAGLKELILDDLGGRARDAGLFFTIEMVAYVLFAPLWGVVSDRIGKRKPLVILGFLASAICYAAYSRVSSLPALFVLRFFQGAFSVLGWSTLMAMVLDRTEEARRGRTMGLMGGALTLGVSLGAPLGGYLSRAFGSRAPLETSSVLFLLMAVGSLFLLESPGLSRQASSREILTALKGHPRLLLPYLFYFVDRYTVGFFVVLFPLYLGSLGVDDPAVRGRYLALFLLPFALLQILTGRLADRVGAYLPLIGGSLAYGVALSFVGFAGLAGLWWVMMALGVLAAVMFPPAIALTAELSTPETRGSAMGGFNLAGSLGFAIGPLVGAWIFEAGGYGVAFISGGVLEVFAALTGLVLVRRWGLLVRRPKPPIEPSATEGER